MARTNIRVLGLVFPGFNVMDLTGPMEVFGHSQHPPETRLIHIASATDVTKSSEGVSIKRDLSFIELLAEQTGGSTQLSTYDILVMPGGPKVHVQAAIDRDENLLRVLQTFAQSSSQPDDQHDRWLLSVCTGAGFLGAARLLHDKTVTTHWAFLNSLGDICARADSQVNVVRKRFVDVGRTETGTRIVTAGGVSCGIDAALWVSAQVYGLEKATTISRYMDYDWKFGRPEITEGWTVSE